MSIALLKHFSRTVMTIRLALLSVLFLAPLASMAGSMPAKGEPVTFSDFTIVAVRPRLLVISVRCDLQDSSSGLTVMGTVRDQDGLPQSVGFAMIDCGGNPREALFNIPGGTGELQHSEVQFTVHSPLGPIVFTKAIPLPAQSAVALPPPTEWQTQLAAMNGPDPQYVAAFRNDFEQGDFKAVDRLLDRLDHDDVKLANGRSADETYWNALHEKLGGPERNAWEQRFTKWQHDAPKSNAANIAAVLAIRYDAWGIRGTSIDSKLDPDARKLFNRRLSDADKLLSSQNRLVSPSPLSEELLIEIMREEKKPPARIEAVGAEAITRFPQHTELFVTLADPNTLFTRQLDRRLQPLEAIDWAHAEQLMRIERAGASPQTGVYALFYLIMFGEQPIEFDPFSNSFANWPDMKTSFDALIKSAPVSENLNHYAAYSCRARDWHTYQTIRSQLNAGMLEPGRWPSNFQPQVCDAQARDAANEHSQ